MPNVSNMLRGESIWTKGKRPSCLSTMLASTHSKMADRKMVLYRISHGGFVFYTFGHLFFRPSAHLLYRTSANCFVCSRPGMSSPGNCSGLSVHISSVGSNEDCLRRWLLRWGLFWARTSFGFCGVGACEGGSNPASFGSLK